MISEAVRVGQARVNFQLRVLGWIRNVAVEIPPGKVTAAELVPLAQRVTDAAVDMSVEGHALTCKMGCAACCRQMVRISTAEAMAIAKLVEKMPVERRDVVKKRFADGMEEYRRAGIFMPKEEGRKPRLAVRTSEMSEEEWMGFVKKYFEVGIACAFLENESCSIYADRPLTCREYCVTSPKEMCERLEIGQIETVYMPIEISERLMDLAETLDKRGPRKIALAAALEWAESANGEDYGMDEGEKLVSLLQMMCLTGQ